MTQHQEITGRINYLLFLVVVALLPFPQTPLRYALVLWAISWLLEGRWLHRPTSPGTNKMIIPFLLFGLWYGWKAVSGLWAPDHAAWGSQMERCMTFALVVPIALWGVNRYYDWRTAGKVLVYSCLIAVPFYIITLTVFYHHPELATIAHGRMAWNYNLPNWHLFVSDNISVLKHRLFLCSVELFGACIACQLWKNKWHVLLPSLAVMVSMIPLTGSRQSVLTAAALLAVGILYAFPRAVRWKYGTGVLLLVMVLGGLVLQMHPRMHDVHLSDISRIREISPEHNVRFNIWGAALQNPSDYLLYGLGGGQSREYIYEIFHEKGYSYGGEQHFHPHNQYLTEAMEIGIFGMLLFIAAWLAVPLCASNKGKKTAVLMTVLFMMNMFTDCMFASFCGIALWAVGMLFIFLQSDAQSEQ